MHSNLVIIGGGPAASAAALLALDSGLTPTVIYPKKKQIDNKPFQSLYPDIIKLLKLIRCEGPLDASKCGRYSFISINGQKTPLSNYKEIPDVGYHINRYRFDQFLLEEVKKRGGNIIHGNAHHFIFDKAGRISGIFTDEGKEIATDFIIDASGVRRFSGKQLKLEEQYFSPEFIVTTGQVSISPVLQEEQIFEFHTEEKGWHWIVAAENTYTWTKLTLKGQQNSRPPNSLEKYHLYI